MVVMMLKTAYQSDDIARPKANIQNTLALRKSGPFRRPSPFIASRSIYKSNG